MTTKPGLSSVLCAKTAEYGRYNLRNAVRGGNGPTLFEEGGQTQVDAGLKVADPTDREEGALGE